MPAPSPLNDLAIAVKDVLKMHSFSLPFRASRGYRPRFLLQEIEEEIQVVVTPASQDRQGADRSHTQGTVSVHIGILKRLPPEATDGPDEGFEENLTDLDALMGLVSEIFNLFAPEDNETFELETASGLVYSTGVSNDQAYDQKHLDECRQFTSILTVEFSRWKGGA